jgi:hypothetical protein
MTVELKCYTLLRTTPCFKVLMLVAKLPILYMVDREKHREL